MGDAFQVRRATLDDVPALTRLWQIMRYPTEDYARKVTEFQVAVRPDGKILGALGIQVQQKHGLIYGESFDDFSVADAVRPVFWDRINTLAMNHGLLRLWTREEAPFYKHLGLQKADEGALAQLPAVWRDTRPEWLTLKLRDDLNTIINADKEFAVFMAAEKERTQRTFQQAKAMKFFATLVALGVLGLVIAGAVWLARNGQLFQPR